MSTDTRQRLQCCLAVCFLTCPGSVYARPLGASLTGQEILCETTTWGPSTSTPGIYAVAVDGQVTRVVTYGRRPLWAPNHRRFLYWREGAVWVADVQEHVTYEVTSLPASLSADALWMPDSDRLVYCGLGAPWPTVQPYSEVAQPGGAVPPTQLWAQAGERVGALSFAADSLRVAYEDGKLLPGLGVYASRLFVRDLRTDGRQPIPIPDPAETLLLNPQWQPGWSLVAFDSISVDNGNARRKSYVYDTRTRVTRPVVVQGAAYTQVIEWSPDSNSLLVMVDPDYASGEGRCSPYIWYVDPQKSPTPVDGYMSHVYEVHWSPNGERVAFLTGDNCLLSVSRGIDLVIWGAKGGCVHVTLPPGLRPVEFDW